MMTFLLFFRTQGPNGQDDVKTENPEKTAQVDFCDIYCAVVTCDILWSSCVESYGPKDTG